MANEAANEAASEAARVQSHVPTPIIADWRLVERRIERQERYYVGKAAEQARAIDECIYSLTVYVDSDEPISKPQAEEATEQSLAAPDTPRWAAPGESTKKLPSNKFRGESTITLFPSFSLNECVARIRHAAYAASISRNPWFSLPGPLSSKNSPSSNMNAPSSNETPLNSNSRAPAALSFADQVEFARSTLYSAATPFQPDARINSLELFISKEQKRLVNSQGVDVCTTIYRGYSEFVVEAECAAQAEQAIEVPRTGFANRNANDRAGRNATVNTVELFDDIEFSKVDPQRLASSIASRLAQVRDRAHTVPMPALRNLPLILRGKEAEQIFAWFFENARTEAIYSKASTFEIGASVQGEGAIEPLELWAEPFIPGLPASSSLMMMAFLLYACLLSKAAF